MPRCCGAHPSGSVSSRSHRFALATLGDLLYTYDLNGNRTSGWFVAYGYNAASQVTSLSYVLGQTTVGELDKCPTNNPECWDLPGSEPDVREAFDKLPRRFPGIYGLDGTSNSIPSQSALGCFFSEV
jgi:hypothetical protein